MVHGGNYRLQVPVTGDHKIDIRLHLRTSVVAAVEEMKGTVGVEWVL